MGAAVDARRGVWLRLLIAPLILLLIAGVLWLHDRTGDPLATDLVLALFGAGAGFEMARMLTEAGHRSEYLIVVPACALLVGIGLLAPEDAALRADLRGALVGAALVACLLRHLRDTRREAMAEIAFTMVPVVYIGLMVSWMREVGAGPDGPGMLLWFVVATKASDMGGWLVGKPFGRHKLIPSVSPGKSWEGLAGGLAASVLAAVFLPGWLGIPPAAWPWTRRALFGLAVGGAAVLAGVTQSGWKRRAGVKDSSPLIPEMGGVLDMLDSMILASPVAWLWLRLGL